MEILPNKTLDNALTAYKTVVAAVEEKHKDCDYPIMLDKVTIQFLEELKEYRKLGTPEEIDKLIGDNSKSKRANAIDEFADLLKINVFAEDDCLIGKNSLFQIIDKLATRMKGKIYG